MFLSAVTSTVTNNTQHYTIIAGVVGLLMVLAKMLSVLVDWIKTKYTEDKASIEHHNGNGHSSVVSLDEDTLKIFRTMQGNVEKSNTMIEDHIREESVVFSNLKEIAGCIRDVSYSQERLKKQFDDRFDNVDMGLRSLRDEISRK